MQFATRKRRHPPAVIIVSLIDVLIVVLIFLMVTTTFKQSPAVKIALPESKQAPKAGASDNVTIQVTINKQSPYIYLDSVPITADKLQRELTARSVKNPKLTLAIRADKDAPVGKLLEVRDAAQAAQIKSLSIYTKQAPP